MPAVEIPNCCAMPADGHSYQCLTCGTRYGRDHWGNWAKITLGGPRPELTREQAAAVDSSFRKQFPEFIKLMEMQ